jgi:hypothetical protein
MKSKSLLVLAFLVSSIFYGIGSSLTAAPEFWTSESATSTAIAPPDVDTVKQPLSYQTATPTPIVVPTVEAVGPTPTPLPGLHAVDPTMAAIFSAVVPGSGQVIANDPLRGFVIASLFGVGLWQTIDSLQLVKDSGGKLVSKDENLGSLTGLGTLAVYGFGIQDAFDTADNYNKKNYLTLNLGISPRPSASLVYNF